MAQKSIRNAFISMGHILAGVSDWMGDMHEGQEPGESAKRALKSTLKRLTADVPDAASEPPRKVITIARKIS